jgi:hypothetical protein
MTEKEKERIGMRPLNDIHNSRNTRPEARSHRKIFLTMLVLSLGSALLLFACDRPATREASIDKRVADLEKQVGILTEQNRDLRIKARAVHAFGRSPLGDFFASAEFWQCTYDSSWADCSSRCSKATADGLAACKKNHPEGPARQECVDDNTERGENCLKNCPVQSSPISPLDCAGGTRPAMP